MAVNLSPVGGVAAQFFTSTGAVLTGGKLYTYAAGTTTPATTYTTSQGTTAWTNPIVLDAAGRVSGSGEIWLTDGLIYKFVLKDANDVLIATYDNITGINSNAVAYTNQQQIVTATAGQTVFNLGISYQPGTNSLSVFVDGVNQYGPGAQYAYTETSSTSVTFTNGLHKNAVVKFTTTQQQGAGAVDASQVTYDPPFTGSVATNVEAKLAQWVSVIDFGADPTGVADSYQAFQDAHDNGSNCCVVPDGIYTFSQPLIISRIGFKLMGVAQSTINLPNHGAVIYPRPGFVGDATIIVDQSSRWVISDLSIEGSKPYNINAIQINDGPLGSIQNVQVRTADKGVKLINGNCQRWWNILAEGCNVGFEIEPDVTDNTNGCVMTGLRATGSVQWGLNVLQGAAPSGHSSSYWDISAEGGFQGISISGGVYCHYELYAEGNSGDEFFIDENAPHYYFLKNIDNQTNDLIKGYAVGWNGTGANLYFDGGFAPDRTVVKSFSVTGALNEIAVKTYVLSNTSSPAAQLNLTLSFLSYAPIGFRAQIYKTDNTTGFIPVAPSGITLLGDTGLFGAYPTSVKKLEIVKINDTQAILVQSGA